MPPRQQQRHRTQEPPTIEPEPEQVEQRCWICCTMPGPRGRIMTCTPEPLQVCRQAGAAWAQFSEGAADLDAGGGDYDYTMPWANLVLVGVATIPTYHAHIPSLKEHFWSDPKRLVLFACRLHQSCAPRSCPSRSCCLMTECALLVAS